MVIWEILFVAEPFEGIGPVDAAIKIIQENMRLNVPTNTPEDLAQIMHSESFLVVDEHLMTSSGCWQYDPILRPDFSEIIHALVPDSKYEMPRYEIEDQYHDGAPKWDNDYDDDIPKYSPMPSERVTPASSNQNSMR